MQEKKSNFFERLEQFAISQGYKNITSFAREALGYASPQKLFRLKIDGNSPSVQIIQDISNKFEFVNTDWLMNGKGEMVTSSHSKPNTKTSNGIPMVPIDALAGKQPGELVIHDYDIEQRYFVPEFSKADFLIRVKGSSMYPKYSAGDILACIKIKKDQFIQ